MNSSLRHLVIMGDMAMKDKALARRHEPSTKMGRYYPPDDALMEFLHAL